MEDPRVQGCWKARAATIVSILVLQLHQKWLRDSHRVTLQVKKITLQKRKAVIVTSCPRGGAPVPPWWRSWH